MSNPGGSGSLTCAGAGITMEEAWACGACYDISHVERLEMSTETVKCPNCGAQVRAGDIECPTCGTNLKTGETFDIRVKRAKQKRIHHGAFARGLIFVPTVGFALVVFAGFMFQKSVEEAISLNADEYITYVQKLEQVEALAASGDKEQARELCKALIEELDKAISTIKIEVAYSEKRKEEAKELPHKKAKRTFLLNLQSKAEHKLNQLS